MGDLRNKRIVQSRIWLDESYAQPLPVYDYDYTYPITVYDAVKKTTDENATTLTDELAAIYRLIAEKQRIIGAGEPGQLMSWSGVAGEIGTINLVKTINPIAAERSNIKVPTERAVGIALDGKTPILDFNLHRDNTDIHITTTERNRWNNMAPMSSLSSHIANQTMHITTAERQRWNAKADASDLDEHIYNVNNPHNVTAHQVNSYTMREVDEMIQGIHESFFNYVNIEYNNQTDEASLVEYDSLNWNPNYVLDFDSELPDVSSDLCGNLYSGGLKGQNHPPGRLAVAGPRHPVYLVSELLQQSAFLRHLFRGHRVLRSQSADDVALLRRAQGSIQNPGAEGMEWALPNCVSGGAAHLRLPDEI